MRDEPIACAEFFSLSISVTKSLRSPRYALNVVGPTPSGNCPIPRIAHNRDLAIIPPLAMTDEAANLHRGHMLSKNRAQCRYAFRCQSNLRRQSVELLYQLRTMFDPRPNKISVRIEMWRQPNLDRASGCFSGFKKNEFAAVANDRHLPRFRNASSVSMVFNKILKPFGCPLPWLWSSLAMHACLSFEIVFWLASRLVWGLVGALVLPLSTAGFWHIRR